MASLKTSSLPLGENLIKTEYVPSQILAPGTAAIVENVRKHRSTSQAEK